MAADGSHLKHFGPWSYQCQDLGIKSASNATIKEERTKQDPLETYFHSFSHSQFSHDAEHTLSSVRNFNHPTLRSRAPIMKTANEPEVYTDASTYRIDKENREEGRKDRGRQYERDTPGTSLEPGYLYLYDPSSE
jgi:hypothetical protein